MVHVLRIATVLGAVFFGFSTAFAPVSTTHNYLARKGEKRKLPLQFPWHTSPNLSLLLSTRTTTNEHDLKEGVPISNPISKTWKARVLPLALACFVAFSPSTSATALAALDPNTFTNDYADPLHPECKRHIQVSANGKSFQFTGTSVDQPKDDPVLRGCSKKEVQKFGLRKGYFQGDILDGNRISAGDGIHEGVWEPAGATATTNNNLGYENVDGIRWNDGNKWVVIKEKSIATQVGEFITYSYIGFSLLAGVVGVTNMYKKKKAEEQQQS